MAGPASEIRDAVEADLPEIVGIYNSAVATRLSTAEVGVYVDENRRGAGIGRRLLAEAVRRAPELGVSTLTAGIFGHNEPSLALFASFGFERWAFFPLVAELDGVEWDLVIVGLRPDSEKGRRAGR